jgi:hypothetical protein
LTKFLPVILAFFALPSIAVTPTDAAPQKITVAQLDQAAAAAQTKPDAEAAQQLSRLELTERLSAARLARWEAVLTGEKARQALVLLADQSEFLAPSDEDVVKEAAPDAAATRQMLVKIVNYVNTTVRQLPNLMAVRQTTSFEDRPQEDVQEPTDVISLSYLPLHFVGASSIAVTYRDRKEVVDESATKALKHNTPGGGLATSGEFGPILSTVLSDALKGKITWARWERGSSGRVGVFDYTVPVEKSNYNVKFCCLIQGYSSSGLPEKTVFDERSSYHGEIVFDPADGSILRLTLRAEMSPGSLVPKAGIAIEYGPVEIGGKNYVCPARSVSILMAHTAQQKGAASRSNYRGAAKTFLNDVVFAHYRRFGSETRILTADQEPAKPPDSVR